MGPALRTYEVMVILDPSLDERTVAPSLDTYLNVVRQDGGQVESVDVWGKRRLAYEIDHHREGIYLLVEAQGEPGSLDGLDRALHLADEVLRHKVVRLPDHAARRASRPPSEFAAPAASSTAAPEAASDTAAEAASATVPTEAVGESAISANGA